MIIVGIDPDLKKSGVCVLVNGEISRLESLTLFELMDEVVILNACSNDVIYAIEDVNKNKAVYSRKTSKQAMLKIAQNVGQVKAACTLIQEMIKRITGNDCLLVPPGVGRQVKNNPELFAKLTGYEKRTNEDKRDSWAIAKYIENNQN